MYDGQDVGLAPVGQGVGQADRDHVIYIETGVSIDNEGDLYTFLLNLQKSKDKPNLSNNALRKYCSSKKVKKLHVYCELPRTRTDQNATLNQQNLE